MIGQELWDTVYLETEQSVFPRSSFTGTRMNYVVSIKKEYAPFSKVKSAAPYVMGPHWPHTATTDRRTRLSVEVD